MTSLFKISEQVRGILAKGTTQELIEAVKQAYSFVAKNQWYEGRQYECSDVQGAFVYTFGAKDPIVPSLNEEYGMYTVDMPSSYLALPHSFGIVQVSYKASQTSPFAQVANASLGLFYRLKSWTLGGNQAYYVENNLMFFPKMTEDLALPILIKLQVGLDAVDQDEPLNIPDNIVKMIVDTVVLQFQPKVDQIKDQINN